MAAPGWSAAREMPKHVLRALVVATAWCKANGYALKVFRVGK